MRVSPGADYDQFFRAMFARTVAAAYKVTCDRAAAEDAAVEALAKAHYRWARIGQEPWRDLWVLRVAINEAIRRLPRSPEAISEVRSKDLADEVVLRQEEHLARLA
jgi:DNA-directed RNA polymerase specialized sigma24 family protein